MKQIYFLLHFFLLILIILSWITYGTIEGLLGMLSFLFIGFLALFPWIIPVIVIPIGLLDLLGIFNFRIYTLSLEIAHLESSWMPLLWFWTVSLVGITLNLIIAYFIYSWIQDLKYRNKKARRNIALINCNIFDGNLESEIISNGIILIKNVVKANEISGLIIAVGKLDSIKIPSDYRVIDLKGGYVIPGLINAHCHIGGSGKPTKLVNISDNLMEKAAKLVEKRLIKKILLKWMKTNALNALNSGVTTLRCLSDPAFLDVKLKKLIENGKILGPRLIVSGKSLSATGGQGGAMMTYYVDSKPEIRKAVRTNLRKEVDCIKLICTGAVIKKKKIEEAGRPQMTTEEIEIACTEAHRGGLMVAAHC
ncbi:MAG: amidohydrolase family protein, partial [Promethearchaeota archaeon]